MSVILVTGGTGQVGQAIARLPWDADTTLLVPARAEMDLGDPASIAAYLGGRSVDLVINSGAYTAVDGAESNVAAAFAINAQGPAILADVTRSAGIPIIHLSTDYIFSGTKPDAYVEDDPVGPLGIYGASKLAGELAVRLGNPRSVVLRTAWVLSPFGKNFLKTMRRLAATRSAIDVVADQIGCPTSADDIARAIHGIARVHLGRTDAPTGVYHFVNGGAASWCDLANAIFALDGSATVARPITTANYPTAARRPANSQLSTAKISADFGIFPRPWKDAVADIVIELQEAARTRGLKS